MAQATKNKRVVRKKEEEIPAPYEEEYFAMVPTPGTKRMRTFLPFQLWRFLVMNWKMIKMIRKSHGDH